jgi:hypothetical protein
MPTEPTLEVRGYSIVLLGSFNPAIFQPYWFASNGLLRPDEAKEATIQVIHNQATIFTAGWLTLKVDVKSVVDGNSGSNDDPSTPRFSGWDL